MKKYKILAFDGWTLGYRNFERLCKPLKTFGIEIKLLHLGSMGDEIRLKSTEKIGDLDVVDISFYQGRNFEQILIEESPDLVMFLSTETFLHRAFIRYCNKLNIPTFYHFHGILSVIYIEYSGKGVNMNKHYNISIVSHILFILKRIPKAIQYTFFIYLKSLICTKAKFSEYCIFIRDILFGLLGYKNLKSAPDSVTNYAAVFIPEDVDFAEKKCGILRNRITVIGNPDFEKFGFDDSMIGAALKDHRTANNEVIYIETAFFLNGLHFDSKSSYIEFIEMISYKCNELGYELIVKLHPASAKEGFGELLLEKDISICDDSKFVSRLLNCKACISEPSSLFLIPAMMGLNILIPKFGPLLSQAYSKLILNYPKSYLLESIDNLDFALNNTKNSDDCILWINANIGPLPINHLGERLSQNIYSILKRYKI